MTELDDAASFGEWPADAVADADVDSAPADGPSGHLHLADRAAPETPQAVTRAAPAEPLPDGLAPLVALLASRAHDPATIREMLEIQREFRADRAREAYSEALARFRALAPTLAKDRTVHFESRDERRPAVHYRHTSLGHAMNEVNPLLGELGLNLSWHPRVENGVIHVETRLTHALGHSESVTLPGGPDTSGSKNAIQAMKSTITYLERTGAFALLGLASSDDDDDGQSACPPAAPEGGFITFDQAEDLSDLLDLIDALDPGARRRWFAHYSGVFAAGDNALGLDIPAAMFDKAKRQLKRRLAERREAADTAADTAGGAAGGAAGNGGGGTADDGARAGGRRPAPTGARAAALAAAGVDDRPE